MYISASSEMKEIEDDYDLFKAAEDLDGAYLSVTKPRRAILMRGTTRSKIRSRKIGTAKKMANLQTTKMNMNHRRSRRTILSGLRS